MALHVLGADESEWAQRRVAGFLATRGVVDALAEWYDLHHDPTWADTLLDT